MQLSTFSQYGLRAMVRLGLISKDGEEVVSVKRISETENISLKYLENIFSILKKHNFIISQKGKKGGYKLTREPELITVLEVIEALEGTVNPVSCMSDTCCNNPAACTAHPMWLELFNSIKQTLGNKTIRDLMNEYKPKLV